MNNFSGSLSVEQRRLALQRLTALWAFSESGLGGVMHALQIPFIGLVVGGLAVIIISLIAFISEGNSSQILKSLLIVLMVKAIVSPYTPFPAYVAVSFQGLMGFVLFGLLRVNFISILLLSLLAMIESAIQSLLILTLFFGQSFWKATDGLFNFIAKQFGMSSINSSYWIAGAYILLYVVGGVFISIAAYKLIKTFSSKENFISLNKNILENKNFSGVIDKRKNKKKTLFFIAILSAISIIIFLLAPDTEQGWYDVLKTISYTVTAIFIWYLIISPLFTKLIQWLLKKNESRYSTEVSNILSLLPVLKQLSAKAWIESNANKGFKRLYFFVATLICWSLISTDDAANEKNITVNV